MSEHQHKPGQRLGQGMLVVSFALALIALTLFFNGWLKQQANPNSNPLSLETADGVREVVLERNRQGHYVVSGTINHIAVTFLLDTGATDVAIPAAVATAAGLEPGLAGRASTANGLVTVYATRIAELQIGNIILNNIDASITPSMSGNTILLGMSALREIEFTQRGTTLTLRQLPARG
ncbi:MAG: retropepsin-like aspartic protease family protein [Pseudohongiellaceae bacterium]